MIIGILFGVLAVLLLNAYATDLVRKDTELERSLAKRSYIMIWCFPVLGALIAVLNADLHFFHQRQVEIAKDKRDNEVFLAEIVRDKGQLIETDGGIGEGGCGDGGCGGGE